jgi:outer membrane protein
MNRLLLIISLSFISYSSFAQKLTLQQCIDTALKNNIDVRQSQLLTDAASVRYKQSKSNLLPSVNGNIGHGINQGRSIDPFTNTYVNQNITYSNYGVNGSLPLFNGLSLRNEMKRFAYAYNAAKLEADQMKVDITLNVILGYLQVLNNEDLLEVSKQQFSVTQQQIERLEVLNKQGAINPPQLHELRGQLKDNELTVLLNQNALQTAKLQLSQVMNVPYNAEVQLERLTGQGILEQPKLAADEIYSKAIDGLAGVKAAELRKKSAEAVVRSTRGALFPILSLNGGANTNYSSIAATETFLNTTDVTTTSYVIVNGNTVPVISKKNNFQSEKIPYGDQVRNNIYTNLGLTLRVPIFNSFQTRNQIRLAEIELKNTQLIEESTKVQLRQQVDQAHLNLINAWSRYKILLEQVESFREAFRAAEVRFNAGVGTSVDYVIAKNNYDRANLNLVIARYDYLLRKQVINYYTGSN